MKGLIGKKVDANFPYRLVSSVTSSIMNLTYWAEIGKIILLFDTPPYAKKELLKNYKGTRYNPTVEEAEKIEDPELREKEMNNAYNMTQRHKAKEILMSMSEIAIPSLYLQGFEADDLVYQFGKYCSSKGSKCLFISVDDDWNYWMSPGCTVYMPKRETLVTYEDFIKTLPIPEGMSLFRYKSLYDTFYGSHNDLEYTIKDEFYYDGFIPNSRMFDKMGFSDDLFWDPELAEAQLKSFDQESYPKFDKVKILSESIYTIGKVPTETGIVQFSQDSGCFIRANKFTHYLETLNPELFKDD